MAIVCPRCSAKVPARDVNLDRMIAKCVSCDEVFRFEGHVGASRSGPRVVRPASISVEGELPPEPGAAGYRAATPRSRGPLRLSYRWFQASAIFFLVFSIFWCGFLAFFYAGLFASDAPLVAFLFPLLHVAVGVGMGYFAIAQLVNRTILSIDDRSLVVRHQPLPWPGAPSVEVSRIRQLFVRRRVARGRRGNTRTSFAVCADVDGVAIDLVRGLGQHDEARYIEQVIEDHLGLEDDPSAGDPP